mmetsp:Transcript_80717/g.218840  ORF Transcript_80717/g.218840 Transcript_80717/m.218840 type:complete len:252 (+) Transcript_80717:270-1025(+)
MPRGVERLRERSRSSAACLAFRAASSTRIDRLRWTISSSALLLTRSSNFSCCSSKSNCRCRTSRTVASNSQPRSATRRSLSARLACSSARRVSNFCTSRSRSKSASASTPMSMVSAPVPAVGSIFCTSPMTLALCSSKIRIKSSTGITPAGNSAPGNSPAPSAFLGLLRAGRRPFDGGGPAGTMGTSGGAAWAAAAVSGASACCAGAADGGAAAGRAAATGALPSMAFRMLVNSSEVHWSSSVAISSTTAG